jgi:hypothetical protein
MQTVTWISSIPTCRGKPETTEVRGKRSEVRRTTQNFDVEIDALRIANL